MRNRLNFICCFVIGALGLDSRLDPKVSCVAWKKCDTWLCDTLSRFATHRHNLSAQNEIVYKNFSTIHIMKIFKRKKCNSCGVITIRMLIFISGKVLMSHFNESHFWSPRKCIMKSAKGQRMTDTLHLESIINSIWLELKSLVSFVKVMLVTAVFKSPSLSPTSMSHGL